jgi:hypothetical protein
MKARKMKAAILALALAASINMAGAAQPGSAYAELQSDMLISGSNTQVVSQTVSLAAPGWLYVQSDGRVYPNGASMISLAIFVNGQKVSNDAVQDWRGSTNPQQRTYNVVGAVYLPAGTHSVGLRASTTGASAYVGGDTNLAALATSATSVSVAALAQDTPQFNFNTVGISEGSPFPATATNSVIQTTVNSPGGPVVSMAAGRVFVFGGYGDPMIGIYANGVEPAVADMTWSINDMFFGAELQAPVFSQALFDLPAGNVVSSFRASESPYNNGLVNNVRYKIGANSRLVSMAGGFQVVGRGLNANASLYGSPQRYAYVCIASSGFNPSCPATGTEVVVGEGIVSIPQGHNGVVMFSAKNRVQGDGADAGGTVEMYLRLNGVRVGSWGVQQLSSPDSVSTRTISASYLSTGANALPPGQHLVQVVSKASGSYRNLSLSAHLPVMWFD